MNWTQRLSRFYRTRIDPLFYSRRLTRRLASYGLDVQSPMEVARLDVALACSCEQPLCHHLFVTYGGYFDQFFYTTDQSSAPLYSKLTLHAIDLTRHASFEDYRAELGQRSSFFVRNAKQAEKKGFVVREFDPHVYEQAITQIDRSMRVRSFGPILPHWITQGEDKQAFKTLPHNSEPCQWHWDRFFGVFAPQENSLNTEHPDRLVAYARVQRIGNCVAYEDLIGHKDFINDGVMKQLHYQIMQWLFEPANPDAKGLEYLVHGSVERGNDGFFFWKKKALFTPYLIELIAPELPGDFQSKEYLRLNPDVKVQGLEPASHYRLYGKKEERHYLPR
jgi:hypothetical protein